jgi:hypothetical protein
MLKKILSWISLFLIFLLQYSLLSFFDWGIYLSLPLIFLANIIILSSPQKIPWLIIIFGGFLLGSVAEINYLAVLIILLLSSLLIWLMAKHILTNHSYLVYGILTFVFTFIFYSLIWVTQKMFLFLNWQESIILPAKELFTQAFLSGIINAIILIFWHWFTQWWYRRYPLLKASFYGGKS